MSRTPSRRAFTLIETITTMVILAVIMTASVQLISSATKGYADAAEQARLNTNASIALGRVVREIQQIPQGSTNGTSSITSLTATSIAWNSTSSITLASGELRLTTPSVTNATLVDKISAFSLTAYDQDNNAMAASLSGSACEPIRRVSISLSLTNAGVTQTLRTRAFIRCCAAGAGH